MFHGLICPLFLIVSGYHALCIIEPNTLGPGSYISYNTVQVSVPRSCVGRERRSPRRCGGELIYVRPAAGLGGRAAVEALSRGSEEGSRNVEAGYFLSTWLWPSSSKPVSTP